jgi:hypothetical protein
MRPAGVGQRLQQLREDEQRHARAHPEQTLHRALTWFVHGCALLAYDDEGASSVVETYRTVLEHLDDTTQQRTHSAWERACLDCAARLRGPLAEVAADPQRHATRDEEIAGPVLLRVPPRAFVGRDTRDAYFPMACLNAAGSCSDGVITPYHATTLVCGVGYFEPDEERDLLTAMRALRTSYEDQPDDRAGLDEQITRRLQAWLQATDRFPDPPA